MNLINKPAFLQQSTRTLEGIYDTLSQLPEVALSSLPAERTALVIVDLINGFARGGALQSPRVEALIPGIVRLGQACGELGIPKVAFADNHTEGSPEFESYPVHCLTGTVEAELVEEIRALDGVELLAKNSTNGFLEEAFQAWLGKNRQIDTFMVVGDCTDICIQQFTITLKTWFNRQDQKSRVIVPVDLVDTYDFGLHNAELLNAMALFTMMGSGVEVVKEIRF
ncbi:MAG TPA: isochorismatase family cysteine hydrolase [Bacillota bacterium]|nr:isochorismatase family cysteine hydrolase [Bacillota bacterium]